MIGRRVYFQSPERLWGLIETDLAGVGIAPPSLPGQLFLVPSSAGHGVVSCNNDFTVGVEGRCASCDINKDKFAPERTAVCDTECCSNGIGSWDIFISSSTVLVLWFRCLGTFYFIRNNFFFSSVSNISWWLSLENEVCRGIGMSLSRC